VKKYLKTFKLYITAVSSYFGLREHLYIWVI